MARKPKRSGLGLDLRSFTGKDGKSYLAFRTGKAKPKAKGTSRASKPRTSATKSKSPPKAGAKAKPGASEAKPIQVRNGAKVPALLSGGNPRIAKVDGDAPVQAYIAASRERATGNPASRLVDQRIRDLGGWRGETLARMRALILEADPEMTEEWKWMGTPVRSHHGIVCTGEAYTKVVKLSHSLGVVLFGGGLLLLACLHFPVFAASYLLQGLALGAAASYLALSLRFWFWGPALGSGVSLLCILGAVVSAQA